MTAADPAADEKLRKNPNYTSVSRKLGLDARASTGIEEAKKPGVP